MSEPFLGALMCVSFNVIPRGWTACNGALLPISQNQALFSLFGTMFGGDGRVNFGLPNLQGRTPVGAGQSFVSGAIGGEAAHTVNSAETPAHVHFLQATSNNPDVARPTGALFGTTTGNNVVYSVIASNLTTLHPASITSVGGSQPHENRQPYLVLNWIVALNGIFPSRN